MTGSTPPPSRRSFLHGLAASVVGWRLTPAILIAEPSPLVLPSPLDSQLRGPEYVGILDDLLRFVAVSSTDAHHVGEDQLLLAQGASGTATFTSFPSPWTAVRFHGLSSSVVSRAADASKHLSLSAFHLPWTPLLLPDAPLCLDPEPAPRIPILRRGEAARFTLEWADLPGDTLIGIGGVIEVLDDT